MEGKVWWMETALLSERREDGPRLADWGKGGQVGASHLVKKHHRGFDDLPPFLELRIMVLLLGL